MSKVQRPIEFKDIAGGEMQATNDSQGIIEGYLNRTSVIDFQDDKSMPGCFAVTIKDAYARKAAQDLAYLWPFLWSHQWDVVLPPGGIFSAEEDRKGLYIKVQMNRDIQLGRELYSSFREGTVSKLSMGYKAIRATWEKIENKSVRLLHEVAVMEGSAVTFPANDLAAVTAVKGGSMNMFALRGKDFDSRYLAQNLDDWQYADWSDLSIALHQAILDLFAPGVDPAAALETDVIPGLLAALRKYIADGVALGYEPSSQDSYAMMGISGAGESKAGYLNASDHAAIKESSTMIMKHAKIIANASANVERANARARAGSLAGWPVYGSMSNRSIFEEREDDAVLNEQLKLIASGLELDIAMKENREVMKQQADASSVSSSVDAAMQRLNASIKSKRR